MDAAFNFAIATVSQGYSAAATSIVLNSGGGARFGAVPFYATWWDATDYDDPSDDPNREIVRVTALSGETLTITRGQQTDQGGLAASDKNLAGKTYKLAAGITADVVNNQLGAFKSATVTLQQADFLALDNAPYTVIPAAGSNNVIFPLAIRSRLTFGARQYFTTLNGLGLWWQDLNNAFGYLESAEAASFGGFAGMQAVAQGSSTGAVYVSGLHPNNGIQDPAAYIDLPIVLVGGSFNAGPAISLTPHTAGSGYLVNDLVTVGGAEIPNMRVASINGGGGVTSLAISGDPSTTIFPGGNNQATSGGTGTGMTVDVAVHVGDGTFTCTVWYTVAAA